MKEIPQNYLLVWSCQGKNSPICPPSSIWSAHAAVTRGAVHSGLMQPSYEYEYVQ